MKNIYQQNIEPKKATITLGTMILNVYQIDHGSYHLTLDSVTTYIGEKPNDLLRFKQSKSELGLQLKN